MAKGRLDPNIAEGIGCFLMGAAALLVCGGLALLLRSCG